MFRQEMSPMLIDVFYKYITEKYMKTITLKGIFD